MADWVCRFLREDNGQDLIEYSLLMAFIAIACLALVGAGRPAVNAIWTTAIASLPTPPALPRANRRIAAFPPARTARLWAPHAKMVFKSHEEPLPHSWFASSARLPRLPRKSTA